MVGNGPRHAGDTPTETAKRVERERKIKCTVQDVSGTVIKDRRREQAKAIPREEKQGPPGRGPLFLACDRQRQEKSGVPTERPSDSGL